MEYRTEHDTMGEVKVPADKYWGAQTQRSFDNFRIGTEKMPTEIIRAFGMLKQAAAAANASLKPDKMPADRRGYITAACGEVISGALDGHFPLAVWQTGSGTQTNMNANEVIANRASELSGGRYSFHPNDDVNLSQSSNDTFPSAMSIAAVTAITGSLLPSCEKLISALVRLEKKYPDAVKTGRTHLQDAVPIKFSQEVSGWRASLESAAEMIRLTLPKLGTLAIGGTAVGTGLNAPEGFGDAVAAEVSRLTGQNFTANENKFYLLTSKDAFVFAHGAIKALGCDLMKIANDVRFLASGPRCGYGEINIPANEPGSSIMPGKVNPTQCEALTMVAVQVAGNDAAIGFAASQGNFELNVYMPVIIYNFLQSVRLLSDAMISFADNCVSGITVNESKMKENLHRSLMTATALNPYIGYENAAKAVKKAFNENITLRESVTSLGFLTETEFDKIYKPEDMA